MTEHSLSLSPTAIEPVAQAFLPDIGHVLPGGTLLPTLTPLDPEQEKRRRFEILAHFLISQTRARPVGI